MTEPKRVLRPKAAARRAYDRMSAVYDWLTAGEGYMRHRLLRLAGVRRGDRILDLGTGTGATLRYLAGAAGSGGFVLGLDLSSGMLARARRRIERDDSAGVRLVQADAARLPLAPKALDVVLMSFTLELFDTPEIPDVLAECARVLRPSGRLVVGCLASRPARNRPTRFYEWLHDRLPEWLDCRPIPVRSVLRESGFHLEVVQEAALWGLPVDLVVGRR